MREPVPGGFSAPFVTSALYHPSVSTRVCSSSIALAALLVVEGLSPSAFAQAEAPTNNDFTLDLYQGPILAPSRVLAMGGAYTAVAQGLGAFAVNAAAPGVRHSHSTSWVEIDVDASLSFPALIGDNDDFDNSGGRDSDYQGYVYFGGGVNVQVGDLGVGAFADFQRYSVSFGSGGASTTVLIGRYHVLAAYQLFGGQVVLGAGARAHSLGVSASGDALTPELGMFGVGPAAGLVVKPDWAPFRLGLGYRHGVGGLLRSDARTTLGEDGVRRAGGLVVPEDVRMPWEVSAGVAVQVGPRPLNPPWLDPHEREQELLAAHEERIAAARRRRALRLDALQAGHERDALALQLAAEQADEERRQAARLLRDKKRLEGERRAVLGNWPREYLLVTADLLVTGPAERGLGMEAFLGQQAPLVASPCVVVASGETVVVSPRVGLEIEPVPGWMHTRFPTYYEPTRFRYAPEPCNDRVGRQHFTFGADVKAFKTTWWGLAEEVTYKVQVYGDLATRYQSVGLGLGVWY